MAQKMEKLQKEEEDKKLRFNTNWTLYFEKRFPSSKKIKTVDNAKDFWIEFNNFRAEFLEKDNAFHVFREDIQPVWEHISNVKGGECVLRISDKTKPYNLAQEVFQTLVLASIGESLLVDKKDCHVCGITIQRKVVVWNIKVWFSNFKEKDAVTRRILEVLKNQGITENIALSYLEHSNF